MIPHPILFSTLCLFVLQCAIIFFTISWLTDGTSRVQLLLRVLAFPAALLTFVEMVIAQRLRR